MDDVAVAWITETGGECASDAINKLKVPLGDYLARKDDARWPWLPEQIRRAQSSSLRSGVGQFETLLGAVGLGGAVDSHLRVEGATLAVTTSQFVNAVAAMTMYCQVVYGQSRALAGHKPVRFSSPEWLPDMASLPGEFKRGTTTAAESPEASQVASH